MLIKFTATARYIALSVFIIRHHEDYGRATSPSNIAAQMPWRKAKPGYVYPHEGYIPLPESDAATPADQHLRRRANATLLMLARNTDLEMALRSVRRLEDRFNRRARYPWTFMNEEPFTDDFKTRMRNIIYGEVTFLQVPRDHWFQPDRIDEEKAQAHRQQMEKDNVPYGGSLSYRNMCRLTQFFFRHPEVQKYRWYWRVEPDVHFHCDITYDPFVFMEDHNKTYSFTIALYEYVATIPTLWDTVKEFTKKNPQYVAKNNAMGFISDDNGNSYNNCHFWSNFEIADMDFWRSEAYTKFFEYLDSKGGFYYERWGDAPVHSIAASLFLDRNQIHFFNDIAYEHFPLTHCPRGTVAYQMGKCGCDMARNFDYDGISCMRQWDRIQDGPIPV
ncbi:glycosyltransferase family 15 protein [Epithele typhae]|uniref:glycosyltransferase family 15 protein n=1 Tax=Epithele typhae TaxID=378194 RepID=UPI0020079D71|nr:glycosyltransferase family 15 protein [Epithele typhae]KAH9930442.1 glycosyltransferase family 15 protein [Epithele typhae]